MFTEHWTTLGYEPPEPTIQELVNDLRTDRGLQPLYLPCGCHISHCHCGNDY